MNDIVQERDDDDNIITRELTTAEQAIKNAKDAARVPSSVKRARAIMDTRGPVHDLMSATLVELNVIRDHVGLPPLTEALFRLTVENQS